MSALSARTDGLDTARSSLAVNPSASRAGPWTLHTWRTRRTGRAESAPAVVSAPALQGLLLSMRQQ